MEQPLHSVADFMVPGHAKELLRSLFEAMVDAAAPERVLPERLPPPPRGRTLVLGAGKAAAAMAKTVEDHWTAPLSGLVVTRYAHSLPCQRVEVVEAGHPFPDSVGEEAARRSLALARGPHLGRSGAGPVQRGWVGPADPAGPRLDAGATPGSQPAAAALGRPDRSGQLRAQASVRHRGRTARSGLRPRTGSHLPHIRRARRRPVCDRVGPDGGRSHHVRGGPSRGREVPTEPPAGSAPPSRRRSRGDTQARRPQARGCPGDPARHPGASPGGGGGTSARRRPGPDDARRRTAGRSTRSGGRAR